MFERLVEGKEVNPITGNEPHLFLFTELIFNLVTGDFE